MVQLPNLVAACYLIYKAIITCTLIGNAAGGCSDYALIIALHLNCTERMYGPGLPYCSQHPISKLELKLLHLLKSETKCASLSSQNEL